MLTAATKLPNKKHGKLAKTKASKMCWKFSHIYKCWNSHYESSSTVCFARAYLWL